MKDELGAQIMKVFVGLRAKTYSYLKDNNDKDKKEQDTKKCIIKGKLNFEDYKNSLEAANRKQKKPFSKNELDVDILKKFIKKIGSIKNTTKI